MAQTLHEVLAGTDEFEFSSVNDDDFSESDVEYSGTYDVDQAGRDYWLGRLYFRSVQAQEVARSSCIDASITELDASLETRLMEYKYGLAFDYLQRNIDTISSLNLVANSATHFEAFHCAIGFVLRRNDTDEISILEACCRHVDGDMQADTAEASTNLAAQRKAAESKREQELQSLRPFWIAIERFKGSSEEMLEVENSMDDRQRSQASITFRGETYNAKGSTAEEAKARAAKKLCEACDDLEIA